MQSIYPIFDKKEKRMIIFISLLLTLSLLCLSLYFELRLLNLIAMLAPIFILFQKFRTKYIINTEEMTFVIMIGKKEWRRVNLNDILRIEIHRKKNNRVKKINLRNSSNLFFTAEPARGDDFVSQIKMLCPSISLEERQAKWYN